MSIDPNTDFPDLDTYMRALGVREHPAATALRQETESMSQGEWSVSPEQAQFLAFLVEAIGARKILELGTFTGYSALMMALAMPADGHIVTCDMEPRYPAVGRKYWEQAGVADKIELRLGAATEAVENLIGGGAAGTFDFVFIDANKKDYGTYYEATITLLRKGGLIAVDNMFWDGSVLVSDPQEKSTRALRQLAFTMHEDARVNFAMLPIRDGMSVAVKR
jgi:predicted O-methyltransferase YrrM